MLFYSAPQGAGLQVKVVFEKDSKKTFHITASLERFIVGAEEMKIKKRDKNNKLQNVTRENWKELQETCENSNLRLLNSSEKQQIIMAALNSLRSRDDTAIPGCPDKKLHNGQAISKCNDLFYKIKLYSRNLGAKLLTVMRR